MSYEQDRGYIPRSFEEIMDELRLGLNEQFSTNYDAETFIGTGWYRFLYPIAQRIQNNEVKISEIFVYLAEYIVQKNILINRPSVSLNGMVDAFKNAGYEASVEATREDTVGEIRIAVNLEGDDPDFAAKKLEIATLMKNFTVGGTVSIGDQVELITLSNGQAFEYKFKLADKNKILFRLTIEDSINTAIAIPSDEDIRLAFYQHYTDRYRMGWNIEPQKYYNQGDALWAASVLVEYSLDDGVTWSDEIHDAEYDELWTLDLEDINVIFS